MPCCALINQPGCCAITRDSHLTASKDRAFDPTQQEARLTWTSLLLIEATTMKGRTRWKRDKRVRSTRCAWPLCFLIIWYAAIGGMRHKGFFWIIHDEKMWKAWGGWRVSEGFMVSSQDLDASYDTTNSSSDSFLPMQYKLHYNLISLSTLAICRLCADILQYHT